MDNLGLKIDQALEELSKLLEEGEPPVKILFMIARQYRLILQAKELEQKGYTEKQITSEMKLHPFVTGKILRQGRSYGFGELEKALAAVLDCDVALKSGAAPRLAMEQLLINLVES